LRWEINEKLFFYDYFENPPNKKSLSKKKEKPKEQISSPNLQSPFLDTKEII